MKYLLCFLMPLCIGKICSGQNRAILSNISDSLFIRNLIIRDSCIRFIPVGKSDAVLDFFLNDYDTPDSKVYYCSYDTTFLILYYVNEHLDDTSGYIPIETLKRRLIFYNRERKVSYRFENFIKADKGRPTIEDIVSVGSLVVISVFDSTNISLGEIIISKDRNRNRFIYPKIVYFKESKFDRKGKRSNLKLHTDLFLTDDVRRVVGYIYSLDNEFFTR